LSRSIVFLFKIECDGAIVSACSYESACVVYILYQHVEKLSTTRSVTALKPARGGNTPFITIQSDRDIISTIYSDVAADWSKPTHYRLICISARLIVNGPPRPVMSRFSIFLSLPSQQHEYATTIEIDIIGSARYRWTTDVVIINFIMLTWFRIAKITRKIARNDSFNCCFFLAFNC